MKKIIALVAVVGMTACGTSPRYPNDISGAFKGSSDASVDSVKAVSQVSTNVFEVSTNGISSAANKTGKAAKSTFDFSKSMSVKAMGISKNSVTFLFEKSKSASQNASELVVDGSKFVVTSTGKVLESSVNASKKTVNVVIELSSDTAETGKNATITVWNSAKTLVLGSATITGNMASKVANWISTGVEFSMDKTGNLVKGSSDTTSEVVGEVVDDSGKVVGFVADAAGNVFTFSKNTSVAVVTSSSDAVVSFGNTVWSSMKTVGSASVDVVKASAKGTASIIKFSGKSVVVVSDSISNLFHSEKY